QGMRGIIPVRKALGAFSTKFLRAGLRADDRGARIGKERIPKGVVAMIVRVEDEPDRLTGRRLDPGKDLSRAPGKVSVNHEDVIFEDNPGAVRRLTLFAIALPEVHAGRKLLHAICLRACSCK